MAATYLTWKKLEEFWKHGNSEIREKLIVCDAVIRSKLMYGLESLQLTKELRKTLDTFQLKGLRQILKIPTTWGQMENHRKPYWSNDRIFRLVNAKINTIEARIRQPSGFLRKEKNNNPNERILLSTKKESTYKHHPP